jgi:hypothetical protein
MRNQRAVRASRCAGAKPYLLDSPGVDVQGATHDARAADELGDDHQALVGQPDAAAEVGELAVLVARQRELHRVAVQAISADIHEQTG